MEPIRASYTLSPRALRPAWNIYYRNTGFGFQLLTPLGALWVIGTVSEMVRTNFADLPGILMGLGLGLCLTFHRPILIYFSDRALKKTPFHGAEFHCSFGEEGFQTSLPGVSQDLAYGLLDRTLTSGEGILLLPNKKQFHWVPRTAFHNPDGYQQLAGLLAEKTKNKVVK